ncbi:MAG: hypothetical protein ACOH18_00595 [Candidatus Saccharimonadaceae bacterium]
MDTFTSLAIVAFAALIHASFQLSVSVLTLLSGHALGAKKSRARILRLTTSYTTGAGVMTLLILSFTSLIFLHLFGTDTPLIVWALVCGLVFGIGIAVWLFYYKRGTEDTELWVPRSFARFLTNRSKKTNQGAEAFSLGLTSVVAELVFIIPTVAIAALVLIDLPSQWQLVGIAIYTIISLLGLFIVWSLIGSGRSLAHIQKWRVANRRFLQFSSGSALIVLGFFVYVSKILVTMTGSL